MTIIYVNDVEEMCQGLRENAFRRSGLKSASWQQPGNGLLHDDPRAIDGPNVSKIIFGKKWEVCYDPRRMKNIDFRNTKLYPFAASTLLARW
jgi:hypothetical protein